jgi:hypothetical protein
MKRLILLFIILASLIAVSVARAEGVNVTLASSDLTAYTGETSTVEMTIQNTENHADQFSIDVWPTYWGGISVVPEVPRVSVQSGSSAQVKLYFSIPIDSDDQRITYNITIKSVTSQDVSTVKMLNLWVIRSVPIYISDIKVERYVVDPMQSFRIETSVTNNAQDPYTGASLQTSILKDGLLENRLDSSIDIVAKKSTLPIETTYYFGRYTEPGIYTIRSELKDSINRVVSTKEASVKLAPVYNITFEKTISYGLLLQTITITVKNEGNTPNGTIISEIMPSTMRPFVFPAGASSKTTDNMVTYSWFIQNLAPGETRTVSYQINLWGAWAVVVVMIVVIMTAFNVVYVPGIAKGFRHRGAITRDKQIQITLEARNRSMHEIRDVIVRDFVPSIAKIVDRFDTVRPKIVRRVGSGTELIWKFDVLKPREERVITYWIIPSVDIPSTLKLTKAYMRYLDKKKAKKVSTSKSVLIKSE